MFDTFFTNIKPKLYRNSTNDFAGYHSNGWNKQASNVAQSLISSLRSLKLGRFRYESVDTTDSEYNGSWIQMLPRVYDASPNDRGGCWSPVELSSSIKGDAEREATVVDRFLRIVQIDRSIPCVLDESQMERFYKRNDHKEILRRLALGSEFDPHARADKPQRKPSLHSRLQGGMNLQICFMNETASDTESPSSDSESCPKLSKSQTFTNRSPYSSSVAHPYKSRPLSVNIDRANGRNGQLRPSSLHFVNDTTKGEDANEADFFTKQARLQIEARMALAQAKDMAHMQMEMERQKQKESPITEIIRNSLEKVGIEFPPEKRRVSRQMLTDMNIAQLQVIVNDLHTQIERLNERLVQYLMERDELHMSQDSMLVDIEDLTRYLGAKEQTNEKPTSDKHTILMMSQQKQPQNNHNSSRYAPHISSK